MIAQYRTDIARAAEETVVNLKELENRIEVLKNDLAILCNTIGHPEAARVAATPARFLGPLGIPSIGLHGLQGVNVSPYAASFPNSFLGPSAVSPYGWSGANAFPGAYAGIPPTVGPMGFTPFVNTVTPFIGAGTPFASPTAISPYTGVPLAFPYNSLGIR